MARDEDGGFSPKAATRYGRKRGGFVGSAKHGWSDKNLGHQMIKDSWHDSDMESRCKLNLVSAVPLNAQPLPVKILI